ncbi:glycoside hydrolase family 2 TIM barrel-domain containing protein [Paenibacillus sp. GCM10027626]|uniref:glycoside hydrolase family 2 protein n=1 Tax=Paenibacillus sp. GCM10027626 TaxID=3273411 RepID=UPI003625CB7E
MINISQNENEWFVKGYWPWVPFLQKSMELGQELMGVTEWIPTKVPGGVHYDLYKAGLIDNPYVDQNSLKCEWVENRWWMYKTVLQRPSAAGSKIELVFKGLDYEASIYVNNELIGEHEGMYHEAVYDLTEQFRTNESVNLIVLLKHAPDEMGQIGRSSLTFTQKSRFGYKWDFSTRLVNLGIWDDVELVVHQDYSFDELKVTTDVQETGGAANGVVNIAFTLGKAASAAATDGLEAEISCVGPNGVQQALVREKIASLTEPFHTQLLIEKPDLWYPNGHGAQPLYEVSIRLLCNGELMDEWKLHTGIRKLRFSQNEGAPENSLPYTVMMNDRRIYIKGVNITPLDHIYGNVTNEQYEWLVYLMKQANVNLVRVWGGGVIEKSYFYELCDKHGIMIWQDFIQSSSGVDNIPSKRPEFLELLETASTAALKERRNHVSLTIWCGGNELMSAENTPSTYEDENVALLKGLVEKHDPQRLFLPTTASGPVEYISDQKGVGHDVHGHWVYRGNPDHYREYGENDYLFHSEFGVPGVSSLKSLQKFLNPGGPTGQPESMVENLVWRHHGEWWDTFERDKAFFGEEKDLLSFSDGSQWVQAEGLRFILEANQRRKFRNSGSIIWQFNEPWPNVSCTNLVDYYGEQKMAYYWTGKAFAPVHVSLDYHRLDYKPGEEIAAMIHVHGNASGAGARVAAVVYDLSGACLHQAEYPAEWNGTEASEVGELRFKAPAAQGVFLVRLEVWDQAGELLSRNEYYFSTKDEAWYRDERMRAGTAHLEITELSGWEAVSGELISQPFIRKAFGLRNTAAHLILFIRPEEKTDRFWMTADEAYFTLLPGEAKTVSITCAPKAEAAFQASPAAEANRAEPEIRFRAYAEA